MPAGVRSKTGLGVSDSKENSMFTWTNREVDAQKIEALRVIVEVEVEDLSVSFGLRGRPDVIKTFLAHAWYYPLAASEANGVCKVDVDGRLAFFMEHWKSKGFAIFDDKIVRFEDFSTATISRTKRIISVVTKRHTCNEPPKFAWDKTVYDA